MSGALLWAVAVGCSGGSAPSGEASPSSTPATSSSTEAGVRLVSLGDSEATANGDEDGTGWVQRYADLVTEERRTQVEVVPRASDGKTSDVLGGADLNAGDDAWDAGTCSGTACYEPGLAAFERNIAEIVAGVAELRADDATVLRAITPPNALTGAEDVIPPFLAADATEIGVFQARALRESTCSAVRAHGGECIDVLTAFNGQDGTDDAYAAGLMNHDFCCYPTGKGHQLIAELLLETGVEPGPL